MKKPRAEESTDTSASLKAFGAANRARLLRQYFEAKNDRDPKHAWAHVYRLLLWANVTTGLAHCYESDKCQPGRPWYARSLAFHDWVAKSLTVEPSKVAEEIDWLFRKATFDLANAVLAQAQRRAKQAELQRAPFASRGMPMPGEDKELQSIVQDVLGDHLKSQPSPEAWRVLVQRIRQYLMLENKRKNLVGEGFEDVLAEIIKRTPGANHLEVHTRRLLHDLPGFNRNKEGEKANKVDLSILSEKPNRRILATVKWSVRSDREKQFASDFTDYVQAESARQPFEYVCVTNEFDPARLMRACEHLAGNSFMFNNVVHINPSAILAVYGDAKEESQKKVVRYIEEGRLIGLGDWLSKLAKK